ncbi:ribonuclease Z [Candidatus Pacearchaeota archaeon]|nr:ribonuclease Z [Candidatus Pacearchaeota archaeon]
MEKIKITFLGTGDSVPTKKRNHTAILLSYKDENILVDCGEGTQRQLKIAEISPAKITKLLITHWHGDHTLGILGLIETLAMLGINKRLEIYGPRGTKRYMNLFLNFIGPYKKLSRTSIEVKEVAGKFLERKEFYVEAKPMSHGIPANAYSFVIKDKMRLDKQKIKKLKLPNSPVLKKLQEGEDVIFEGKKIKSKAVSYLEKGRKVTFILDTRVNANAVELSKNSDLLICESSFSKDEAVMAKERKHLTSKDAATIAKKAKVKKLFITHISQRYEYDLSKILKEAKEVFPKTEIANDFDVVEI